MKLIIALLVISSNCLFGAESTTTPTAVPTSVLVGDLGFNREILIPSSENWVPARELDGWPTVKATVGITFPVSLLHTGFVGRIWGFIVFNADGGIKLVGVSGGNSQLLENTAEEYVKGLRFSSVTKGGHPVASMLCFECFITEQGTYGPIFEGSGRTPNKSVDVTPTAVTPAAGAPGAPSAGVHHH